MRNFFLKKLYSNSHLLRLRTLSRFPLNSDIFFIIFAIEQVKVHVEILNPSQERRVSRIEPGVKLTIKQNVTVFTGIPDESVFEIFTIAVVYCELVCFNLVCP